MGKSDPKIFIYLLPLWSLTCFMINFAASHLTWMMIWLLTTYPGIKNNTCFKNDQKWPEKFYLLLFKSLTCFMINFTVSHVNDLKQPITLNQKRGNSPSPWANFGLGTADWKKNVLHLLHRLVGRLRHPARDASVHVTLAGNGIRRRQVDERRLFQEPDSQVEFFRHTL